MHLLVLFCISILVALANGAALEQDDILEEGLYSRNDHVLILGKKNFDNKVYGQSHALVIQFYNSFCGHCRKFAPKYKLLAAEIAPWSSLVKLAVVDCNVEANNAICRDFEVMAYPTLKYFHENFQKGNSGDRLNSVDSAERVKNELIAKLQAEQSLGRLTAAPALQPVFYPTLSEVLDNVGHDAKYIFLIFENEESHVGSEVILSTHAFPYVRVKSVFDTSPLAPPQTPALIVVQKSMETLTLTPKNPTGENMVSAIKSYLKTKNYEFPAQENQYSDTDSDDDHVLVRNHDQDLVYYNDLEASLHTALHTEITRYKILKGEALQDLLNFLDVVVGSFPFKHPSKGRDFIIELRNTILSNSEWQGNNLYDLVKQLEAKHAPVYITNLKFVGCKGSQNRFRGYSCGLWTLFHTLTVNAARLPGVEGPRVLRAMNGYVKNFFGCTDCAQHFQRMATNNRIFDVKDNDKAVLWLWISHNEVNLRLAGDETEDPEFPKIQFPSAVHCADCRLARGAWNLPAVARYLQSLYSAEAVVVPTRRAADSVSGAAAAPAPFTTLDYGMLSLLYILSFLIILLVVKLFLSKRFYRRRIYKHDGWGKV